MKDSYLPCFHNVDLIEEKQFWKHRREICVLHMLLNTLSWWGECVTYSSVPESAGFHSFVVFSKLAFPQEELLWFQEVRGTRSQTSLTAKEGVLVLLYTPPTLPFPPCCCLAQLPSPYRRASSAWEMLFLGFFQALFWGQSGRNEEI